MDVDNAFLHPEGYLSIMRGDAAAVGKGRLVGNLNGAPKIKEHDERYNPFDKVYGQSGDVTGNEQIEMVRAEIEISIISLTLENLKLIRPDAQFAPIYGADGLFASLVVGATNAAYRLTAVTRGTGGNSVRYAAATPAAANVPLSVAVAGNDITVTHATGATAGVSTSTALQIVTAINAYAPAAALVSAALNTGSDGSGLGAALTLTTLSGGTIGTQVGVGITRRASIAITDYRKNIVLVWSTSDKTIGGAYILRKTINVEEDKEYGFDDGGDVFGVDCTFRCHTDGTTIDIETGVALPNFTEAKYGSGLVIPA